MSNLIFILSRSPLKTLKFNDAKSLTVVCHDPDWITTTAAETHYLQTKTLSVILITFDKYCFCLRKLKNLITKTYHLPDNTSHIKQSNVSPVCWRKWENHECVQSYWSPRTLFQKQSVRTESRRVTYKYVTILNITRILRCKTCVLIVCV